MLSKNIRVVCFGDSITGLHPHEPYHHQFLKFSDLLGLMLEARRGLGTAVVLNRGWAGQTAVEAFARFEEDVLNESPNIAIVLLGGNDAARYGPRHPDTRNAMASVFSRLQEAGVKTLALQYHLLVNPASPDTAWRHLTENNELIAELALIYDAEIMNMGLVLEDAVTRTPLEQVINMEDGVHLAFGGEMVYARSLFARLDELGWIH